MGIGDDAVQLPVHIGGLDGQPVGAGGDGGFGQGSVGAVPVVPLVLKPLALGFHGEDSHLADDGIVGNGLLCDRQLLGQGRKELDGIGGDLIAVGIGDDAVQLPVHIDGLDGQAVVLCSDGGLGQGTVGQVPVVPLIAQAHALDLHGNGGLFADGGGSGFGLAEDCQLLGQGGEELDGVGDGPVAPAVGDDAVQLPGCIGGLDCQGIGALADGGPGEFRVTGIAVVPLVAEVLTLGLHPEGGCLTDGGISGDRLTGDDNATGLCSTAGGAGAVFVVMLTRGILIVIRIAVAADTGISGISLFNTGGCGDFHILFAEDCVCGQGIAGDAIDADRELQQYIGIIYGPYFHGETVGDGTEQAVVGELLIVDIQEYFVAAVLKCHGFVD